MKLYTVMPLPQWLVRIGMASGVWFSEFRKWVQRSVAKAG